MTTGFDVVEAVSKFQSLSCSSSYNDLTQCLVITTCFPTTCATQYSVKCNGKLAVKLKIGGNSLVLKIITSLIYLLKKAF